MQNNEQEFNEKHELIGEVNFAARAFVNAIEQVTDAAAYYLGLNKTDHRCLDILTRHDRMTAGELAEASGLTTGSVTAVLDRLEQSGYVHRVHDTSDRRRVFVEVAPESLQRGEAIYHDLVQNGIALLDTYSKDELTLVLDFLQRAQELNVQHAARIRALVQETSGGDDHEQQ